MASNKRKNYYAIAGSNGYGAYNNYEKVLQVPMDTEHTIIMKKF